jgi:calpain-15
MAPPADRDTFEPAPRPNPFALPDPAAGTWGPGTPTELFDDNGPTADDARQNGIGDCWMVAALSSLAHVDPGAIRDMIRPVGNNQYDVRLFFRDETGQLKPHMIRVDGTPSQPGSPAMRPTDGDRDGTPEVWASLVEKALAKAKGGYPAINGGDALEAGIHLLTGQDARGIQVPGQNPETVWAALEENKRVPVTVAGLVDGSPGPFANHAFAVLETSVENGRRMVTMRNPLGALEPGNDGKNDGIFKVSLEEFMQRFHWVSQIVT